MKKKLRLWLTLKMDTQINYNRWCELQPLSSVSQWWGPQARDHCFNVCTTLSTIGHFCCLPAILPCIWENIFHNINNPSWCFLPAKEQEGRPESKVSSVLQLTQVVASFRDFKSTAMVHHLQTSNILQSCELYVQVSLDYQSKSSKSSHLFCVFVLVTKEEGPFDGYIFAGAFFSLRVMKDHQQWEQKLHISTKAKHACRVHCLGLELCKVQTAFRWGPRSMWEVWTRGGPYWLYHSYPTVSWRTPSLHRAVTLGSFISPVVIFNE